jgi:hypothetical protein
MPQEKPVVQWVLWKQKEYFKLHCICYSLYILFHSTFLQEQGTMNVHPLFFSCNFQCLVCWCIWFENRYIVAVSFIGGGNQSTQRKPPTCRKSLTNFMTWCCIEYTSPGGGWEVTTLVVIGTDCTGSYKSKYHTIMTVLW